MNKKIKKPFTAHCSPFTEKNGFTLVELAIVLVVIGLLIGLGASLIGPLTKRAKLQETREIVKQAKEAVLGYAVKNGYLPATLDDAGARKRDAWGRDLQYKPADELLSNDACSVSSTTIRVRECTNTDCSNYNEKSNIAFVVYSKGEDANGACTGTTTPFYIREQGMPYSSTCTYNPTDPQFNYDDIVEYITLYEIIARRCAYSQQTSQGLCPGNCSSNCNITFKNSSNDNNIWIENGNNCTKVDKNGSVQINNLSGGDIILVYNNASCKKPIDSLKLANPMKNSATLEWYGPGSAVCN